MSSQGLLLSNRLTELVLHSWMLASKLLAVLEQEAFYLALPLFCALLGRPYDPSLKLNVGRLCMSIPVCWALYIWPSLDLNDQWVTASEYIGVRYPWSYQSRQEVPGIPSDITQVLCGSTETLASCGCEVLCVCCRSSMGALTFLWFFAGSLDTAF